MDINIIIKTKVYYAVYFAPLQKITISITDKGINVNILWIFLLIEKFAVKRNIQRELLMNHR